MSGKFKTQDGGLSAGCHLETHHANRLFARGNTCGLRLPVQYLELSLSFYFESACLLIAELRVDEAIQRLGGAHAIQLINRGRVNDISFVGVVSDSITNQQPAILFINV